MSFDRTQIEDGVREVLIGALGSDPEDVTPTATLNGDLGAESIDFLDIQFRLEKRFSTPAKAFKIAQGELFPENLMQDTTLVENGKVTDKGIMLLKEKMPHIDFSSFDKDRSVGKLAQVFTVKSLTDFVDNKLKA